MTLTVRKRVVVVVVSAVLLLANAYVIVDWLATSGAIQWARAVRAEYLTGTALTIIAVLGSVGKLVDPVDLSRCHEGTI